MQLIKFENLYTNLFICQYNFINEKAEGGGTGRIHE